MINSHYGLILLNELFRTKGNTGESYEDEYARLKADYQLVELGIGGIKYGFTAQKFFDAFKNDNYEQGENYTNLMKKVTEIDGARWFKFTKHAEGQTFSYTLNGAQKTFKGYAYYLERRDDGPVEHYPNEAYLALFTQMPGANGLGYKEPAAPDYMRINLHWSLLTGSETLNQAMPDEDNSNISTISNKEIIMFPEISNADGWGTIYGFGVFDSEEIDSTKEPILWGRLKNENGISATQEHVPLFRKGNFQVTLS